MGFFKPTTESKTVLSTAYKLMVEKTLADGTKKIEQIGAAQKMNPSERRDLTESFQIGDFSGDPFELVPSLVRDKTLEIDRLSLYKKSMLEVFGDDGIVTLSQQDKPFVIYEGRGDPTSDTEKFDVVVIYDGCWIKSYSATRDIARGDIREMQSTTIGYRKATSSKGLPTGV